MDTSPHHHPVLLSEVLDLLQPEPGDIMVDATLGAGGHAEAILDATGDGGMLIGIDRDPSALEIARTRLVRFGDRCRAVHGNHEDLVRLLQEMDIFAVDGIVADLGASSMQFDTPGRGFSFRNDGPLDMRMDPTRGETAADLLAGIGQDELARILHTYGEERNGRRIAAAIVRRRQRQPIRTTRELAEVVEKAAGPAAAKYRIHPATRTFQALRIAVNGEVEGIGRFVTDAASILKKGARLAVISFHSLEDRAVKQAMKALADRCTCPPDLPVCGCGRENYLKIITRKPRVPLPTEVALNPRARSARLRVAERIG